MTAPMDYEGFCAGGDVEASLLASGLPRRAEEILRYRAFIRAAVPWMKKRGHERGCKKRGFAAAYGGECTCGLLDLTDSFPSGFPKE